VLKGAEQKLGLITAHFSCLTDDRQAGKVKHSIEDLLCQRIHGLTSGYSNADDAAVCESSLTFYNCLRKRNQ
jgi:hypothetical protein